jgi:hypothetical protein
VRTQPYRSYINFIDIKHVCGDFLHRVGAEAENISFQPIFVSRQSQGVILVIKNFIELPTDKIKLAAIGRAHEQQRRVTDAIGREALDIATRQCRKLSDVFVILFVFGDIPKPETILGLLTPPKILPKVIKPISGISP